MRGECACEFPLNVDEVFGVEVLQRNPLAHARRVSTGHFVLLGW